MTYELTFNKRALKEWNQLHQKELKEERINGYPRKYI